MYKKQSILLKKLYKMIHSVGKSVIFVYNIHIRLQTIHEVIFMKKIDLVDNNDFFRGTVAPFARMNKTLLDFYSCNEAWLIRSKCASGVIVKFNTDAEELQFDIKFGSPAREIYTTDVMTGGKLTTIDGAGVHTLKLTPGSKTITIYLPHLAILEKFDLFTNDNASAEPVIEKQHKLLVCGDSILQGMTCSTPSKANTVITSQVLGMHLHNTSVGGAKMEPTPVKATLDMGGENDIAVVGFGANDAAQKLDKDVFRAKTRQVLEYLNAFAGKSLIITPIPAMVELEERREEYCQIIREEHRNCSRVTLLEGSSFFPAGKEELYADKLHPNDEGMKIYAEGLIKAIRSL